MKAPELRKLTYTELGEKMNDAKEELFNLRFQLVTNQLDNTARIAQMKQEIARIKTVMREQELAAWESQQQEGV